MTLGEIQDIILNKVSSMCYKDGYFVQNIPSSPVYKRLKESESWPNSIGWFEKEEERWYPIVFEILYLSICISLKTVKGENMKHLPQLILQEIRSRQMNTNLLGKFWITEITPSGDTYYNQLSKRIDLYGKYKVNDMEGMVKEFLKINNFGQTTNLKHFNYFLNEFKNLSSQLY